MLDTHQIVETPEGVELRLHVAGPVPRALAWVIDQLIRGAGYVVLGIGCLFLGKLGMGIFFIAIFLAEWFYPVLFEVYRHGQTPGKRAMGLAVVEDNGTPVDWAASMIRNLLRAVDFLPLLYGFGLVSILLTRDFKRLGDLAGGTWVVHRERSKKVAHVPAAKTYAPLLSLNLDEQRAVISFAERSESIPPERLEELAGIVFPTAPGSHGEKVGRLHATADWLLGRRE